MSTYPHRRLQQASSPAGFAWQPGMKLSILLFAFLCFTHTCIGQWNDSSLNIIPAPKSIQKTNGTFTISSATSIFYDEKEDQPTAVLCRDYIKQLTGLNLPVKQGAVKSNAIVFSSKGLQPTNAIDSEAYRMEIKPASVVVTGKNAGLFYGFQTLIQLIRKTSSTSLHIPCAVIDDAPRFRYRGLHLDVALHMFPVWFVKRYIDLMATYKLNTFHWHLTEDQGWRIEIKKYPELTKSGAWRAQTLIGSAQLNPMGYDSIPHGGFYTQEEVKDMVKYAADRHITVLPEIELPGHCISALVAYPYLGCGDNPGPYKMIESWGIYEDVFCAGKETTFKFLEDVLTEVMELFPSGYIHIGGDEVPKTRWKTCKYCQQRIKDQLLKDEHELQNYFVSRIEKFVNSKGRSIIGWDEILEGGLAPNATVMSWRGEAGGLAAAKMNHDVIMAPNDYIYFDHYQGKPSQEPLGFPGLNSLARVYSYDPQSPTLTPEQQKYIIGTEACLWTEYVSTTAKAEYMLLPRLLAFSEIAWSARDRKNFNDFQELRLPVHLAAIDSLGLVYRVPTAIGANDDQTFQYKGEPFRVELRSPVKGAKIFYNFDDIDPRETDYEYTGPIIIRVPNGEKRILRTIVITPSGKRSNVTRTVFLNSKPSALK